MVGVNPWLLVIFNKTSVISNGPVIKRYYIINEENANEQRAKKLEQNINLIGQNNELNDGKRTVNICFSLFKPIDFFVSNSLKLN